MKKSSKGKFTIYEENDACSLDAYSETLAEELEEEFNNSSLSIAVIERLIGNEFLKTNSKVSTNTANIQALQAKETEHDTSIQALQTNVQNLQLKDEEHDASIQELQTKNTELKAENEAYKRQLPAGQKSGEYITLNDSSDLAFDELKITGNDRQEKRSGKNVFDKSQSSKIKGRAKQTETEKGVRVEMLQESNWGYVLYLLQDLSNYVGKTVRMKANYQASSTNIACFKIGLSDANASDGMREVKASSTASGDEISFVVPILTDKTYLIVWLYANNPVDTTQAQTGDYVDYTNIIITIDNEDMTYEEYGAMPSLDYKSEIEAVEEANIVVCNKNFLDIEKNANLTINGLTVTTNENGEITINGTSTAQVYLKLYESKLEMGNHGNWNKKLLKKGAYTLSAKDIRGTASDDNFSVLIRTSTTSAESIAQLSRIPSATTAKKSSFELEEDTKLVVWAWLNKNITFTNFKFKLQLEQGNEETDYVANEQQNLTITAQQKMFEDDYFDLKNKKEVHMWKKKVLDGTEDYNISSASTDDYYAFQTVIGIDNDTATNKLYCEELAYDGFQGTEVKDYENIALNSSNKNLVRIWIKSSRLTAKTVVALKNYLSEHNITFYYKSIAPTSLACTETQIQQLEAIEKAHGYKTITNIYCTDSLSANMQVAYRKDLETYINNKDKEQDARLEAIEQLLTTTQTSALLLDNLEADLESEV